MKKYAFTLAEVLVTLTIIGIIASITIPNLMQNWRKHERITQIKTAYSIIQNATRMAIAEHGTPDGWDFNNAFEYIPKYFAPYVKIQKQCGDYITEKHILNDGCFTKDATHAGHVWYNLNGSTYINGAYGLPYFSSIILQNGMHVAIWAPQRVNLNFQRNIYFFVDVDGKQGSTTLGKDIFSFRFNLDSKKFYTGYAPAEDYLTDCTTTGKGTACASIIEKNHWEFPDNYPVKKF